MNRVYKFRAWDDKDKKWLLGYEYSSLGGFDLCGECILFGEWSSVVNTFLFEKDGRKFEDLKIMQFTGLQDKNGKDVYDGDILQDEYKHIEKVCWLTNEDRHIVNGWYIVWDDGDICGIFNDAAHFDIEVIGNIFENDINDFVNKQFKIN